MGVLVLPPHDILRNGAHHQRRRLISPPRSKPRRSSTTTTTATQSPTPANTRSSRRKQWSPTGSPPPQSKPDLAKSPVQIRSPPPQSKPDLAKSPGQIRILKRGEELAPTKATSSAPSSSRTTPERKSRRCSSVDRPDSGPIFSTVPIRRANSVDRPVSTVPVQKPFISGFYAGSAFSTSPPPSDLPVPAFCSRIGTSLLAVEDVAVDLRKILRLEF